MSANNFNEKAGIVDVTATDAATAGSAVANDSTNKWWRAGYSIKHNAQRIAKTAGVFTLCATIALSTSPVLAFAAESQSAGQGSAPSVSAEGGQGGSNMGTPPDGEGGGSMGTPPDGNGGGSGALAAKISARPSAPCTPSFSPRRVTPRTGALFYAIAMMYTSRVSRSGDAVVMGIVQVGVIGILTAVFTLAQGRYVVPAQLQGWAYLAALVVVCTAFGFTLQPLAQRPLSSEQASILCALNPLVATVLGVTLLGEKLGVQGALGLALILAAIALSSVKRLPRTWVFGATIRHRFLQVD